MVFNHDSCINEFLGATCCKWIWISNCINNFDDSGINDCLSTWRRCSLVRTWFKRDNQSCATGCSACFFQRNNFGVIYGICTIMKAISDQFLICAINGS